MCVTQSILMCTYTHTHTHTRMYTYTHILSPSPSHTHTQTHIHTHMHTHTNTYTHTSRIAYMLVQGKVVAACLMYMCGITHSIITLTNTCIRSQTHAHTQIHMNSISFSPAHTHTRIHTHTLAPHCPCACRSCPKKKYHNILCS